MLDLTVRLIAEVPQLVLLNETLNRLHLTLTTMGAQLMANFTELSAQLAALSANHQALGAALAQEMTELAAVIASLSNDTADQAAVDAAVTQLQAVNAGLMTIKTGIEGMVTPPDVPPSV